LEKFFIWAIQVLFLIPIFPLNTASTASEKDKPFNGNPIKAKENLLSV
jgi:hypothetical protein